MEAKPRPPRTDLQTLACRANWNHAQIKGMQSTLKTLPGISAKQMNALLQMLSFALRENQAFYEGKKREIRLARSMAKQGNKLYTPDKGMKNVI